MMTGEYPGIRKGESVSWTSVKGRIADGAFLCDSCSAAFSYCEALKDADGRMRCHSLPGSSAFQEKSMGGCLSLGTDTGRVYTRVYSSNLYSNIFINKMEYQCLHRSCNMKNNKWKCHLRCLILYKLLRNLF